MKVFMTALVGLCLLTQVSAGSAYPYEKAESVQNQEDNPQEQNEDAENTPTLAAAISPQGFQLQFTFQQTLPEAVDFEIVEDDYSREGFLEHPQIRRAQKVLFGRTIAPNAP
ncbi:MAG: hypothetical protein AAF616_04510 [Bacteroidota bacterium]